MDMNSKKNLIIYYSYSGNNRQLAEYLGSELEAQVVPIIEKKQRTSRTIFFDVFLRRTPQIKELPVEMEDFDHLVFLAPLWSGRIANPLKSLLKGHKSHIRNYSFVTLSGGYDKKDQLSKVRDELTELIGHPPEVLYEVDVADLFPQDQRKTLAISSYQIKPEDLSGPLKTKINELINLLSTSFYSQQRKSELEAFL